MLKRINLTIFDKFFHSEKSGAVSLLFCVFAALFIFNSWLKPDFDEFLKSVWGIENAFIHLKLSVAAWINDALMAIFFLLVGLEIKRELIEGELSTVKKATLPVLAAIGGMIFPALIYVLFNHGEKSLVGWGIPMATDIAFALAAISLLGRNVPTSLKIFLAALAIADDLGAIVVIALFYTKEIHFNYLIFAGLALLIPILFNRFNVKNTWLYVIPGIFVWYFIHHSGIHATIAGVLLAFTVPTNTISVASPLERLEHSLTIPVNYLIIPLFAFVNTNITFEKDMLSGLTSPLGLGIIFGLFVGKTIGISLMSWLAVKLKIAKLPSGVLWRHIIGLGMIAGIGFTMSIFVAMLSFDEVIHVQQAKFATLTASLIAGVTGFVYLKFIGKSTAEKQIGR